MKFPITFESQEQFEAEARKLYPDYNGLKSKAEKYDTDLAAAQKTITELTDAKTAAENANLRMRAALSHKLPVELATEDEINADAEKLANFFPAATDTVPPPPGPAPLASTEGYGAPSASDAALLDLASKL